MNLVRSHSAGNGKLLGIFPFCAVDSRSVTKPTAVSGVGKPLTPERSRMLLALRINVLAKGYSGISLETLQQVIEAFNGKKMLTESSHCLLLLLCLCFLFSCSLELVVVRNQDSVFYKLRGRGFLEELVCEQKCQERLMTKQISSGLSRKLLAEAGSEPG